MRASATLVQDLAAAPLFQGLPPEHLEKIAAIVRPWQIPRGTAIFAEGDAAEGFFMVAEGLVKVYKLGPDGKEQILHLFGPGEPFAEVAVFTGTSYPAHALAMEKCRLFFFPKQAFAVLIGEHPQLAMNMMAALSLRLKKFSSLIEDLSLKEVPSRLAAHLLYLAGEQRAETVQLRVAKGQLASLLGTIPETLSRILAKMSRQGFISMEGGDIGIRNRQGLEELAAGERRL